MISIAINSDASKIMVSQELGCLIKFMLLCIGILLNGAQQSPYIKVYTFIYYNNGIATHHSGRMYYMLNMLIGIF